MVGESESTERVILEWLLAGWATFCQASLGLSWHKEQSPSLQQLLERIFTDKLETWYTRRRVFTWSPQIWSKLCLLFSKSTIVNGNVTRMVLADRGNSTNRIRNLRFSRLLALDYSKSTHRTFLASGWRCSRTCFLFWCWAAADIFVLNSAIGPNAPRCLLHPLVVAF